MALAAFAVAWGWVRIVPLHWPTVEQHTRRHSGLVTAIDAMHLKNAVVLASPDTMRIPDGRELTTNLPVDLYPEQEVVIALDQPDAAACLRTQFPGRSFYRASGLDDVTIAPF